MHKILKNILNIILYIIFGIVVIYALNIVYFKVVKKEKLPRVFNYYIFNVITGSMEDTIHVGDYIIVKKTNDVKENDIVTFKSDGVFITHRIISIDGDKIITKGDANNTEDDPISKKQIVGKYKGKAKIINFIIKYKILIIGFILVIYVMSMLFKLINKQEK